MHPRASSGGSEPGSDWGAVNRRASDGATGVGGRVEEVLGPGRCAQDSLERIAMHGGGPQHVPRPDAVWRRTGVAWPPLGSSGRRQEGAEGADGGEGGAEVLRVGRADYEACLSAYEQVRGGHRLRIAAARMQAVAKLADFEGQAR